MTRSFVIQAMLDKSQKLSMDFFLMNWTIAYADERTSFITTDQPLGFIVPDEFRRSHEPVLGLGSEKITKLVPLSQRVAMIPGTRIGVDHVPHPSDPKRTFLIARRVLADCLEVPPKVVLEQ